MRAIEAQLPGSLATLFERLGIELGVVGVADG